MATHDPVPHRQLAVLHLEAHSAEAAAGGQELLAGAVEPVDLDPASGQHDDLLGRIVGSLLPGRPPVLQQGQGGGRLGVGGHHPVMGPVGGHRLLHQPTSHELQGFAFPSLVLAAVLHQLAGSQAQSQGAEAAAGINRRQLPVVADQHHLGLRVLGMLKQAAQLAAAHHAGLVHH